MQQANRFQKSLGRTPGPGDFLKPPAIPQTFSTGKFPFLVRVNAVIFRSSFPGYASNALLTSKGEINALPEASYRLLLESPSHDSLQKVEGWVVSLIRDRQEM